jgi:hypothetical protein
MKTTMQNAMLQFKGEGEAFIICGSTEPDGDLGLRYQGSLQQLKIMFRHIRETLKEEQRIGNHPRRPY